MNWNESISGKEWTIECGGSIEGDFSGLDQLFKLGKPKHVITFVGEVGTNYYMLKQLGAKFYTKKIKGKHYARPFYLNMYSMEREVEIIDNKYEETDEAYSFTATFQGTGWPNEKSPET